MLFLLLFSCSEPEHAPDPAPVVQPPAFHLLSAWMARVKADPANAGATLTDMQCIDGSTIQAALELPALPRPQVACWSVISFPGARDAVRISEISFASSGDAAAALDLLKGRGDGGDPLESCAPEPCKALAAGWLDYDRVEWITTRAAGWEDKGCAVLWSIGRRDEGMYHCPDKTPSAAIEIPAAPLSSAYVSVTDLIPPLRLVRWASTYDLADLAVPTDGVRERQGGVEVVSALSSWLVESVELGGGVLDGLREGRHIYLPPTWTAEDRDTYAEVEQRYRDWMKRCPDGPGPDCDDQIGYSQSRLVRLRWVGPDTVSAWIATSSYSGGAAHANNLLSCATWSRKSGRRLKLSDVLGATEAAQRLSAIDRILRYSELGESDEPYYQLGLSELDDVSWPTTDTDNILLDGQADPLICMPVRFGPGGGSRVVRLGRL